MKTDCCCIRGVRGLRLRGPMGPSRLAEYGPKSQQVRTCDRAQGRILKATKDAKYHKRGKLTQTHGSCNPILSSMVGTQDGLGTDFLLHVSAQLSSDF